MKKTFFFVISLCFLISKSVFSAPIETITIGKGTGVIWEGLPFDVTLSGSMDSTNLGGPYGIMNIADVNYQCMMDSNLTTIAGIKVIKIAQGIGLVPRAIGTATYTAYDGTTQNVNATIGLPETQGNNGTLISPSGRAWCVPPSMTPTTTFYSATGPRNVHISGKWALVADGTQLPSIAIIPPMYASSFSMVKTGDRYASILPQGINLRISTLECNVSTPAVIDFGTVGRNLAVDSELAKIANELTVSCKQPSDYINANIAVQFRNITNLYDGSINKLSLAQGGGYISGEIPGVSGSGSCGSNSGINFDSIPMKIGNITSGQSAVSLTNQLIWRLCSGGASLPTGPVSASAELLVTFN